MKKQILAVTSLILVAGCTPVAEFLKESADPDSSMSRAYGEKLIAEEMEAYKKQGNSIVKGQAFLTTPGETRFAAGCEVWLIPTTLGVNSYRIGMYINNFEIIHDLIDKVDILPRLKSGDSYYGIFIGIANKERFGGFLLHRAA